ncbi:MAG: hypothetical protein AB7N54_18485 [Alphaproteobacteria bacterium]
MRSFEQWRNLSNRIHSLMHGIDMYVKFLAVRNSDSYRAGGHLRGPIFNIIEEVRVFSNDYPIPDECKAILDAFVGRFSGMFSVDEATMSYEKIQAFAVAACTVESEVSYALRDNQEHIRAASELAFMHLKRIVTVDDDLNEKWRQAFDHHETKCEKLGAVHLLYHGIWAFKADATGARTDLIFQDPIRLNDKDTAKVLGLVLTEWKIARNENEAEKYREAYAQANIYTDEYIKGVELEHYRYLVVVSKRRFPEPADFVEDGIIYRHVHIALEPNTPSADARRGGT